MPRRITTARAGFGVNRTVGGTRDIGVIRFADPPGLSLTGIFALAKGRKFGSWIAETKTVTAAVDDWLTASGGHDWELGQALRFTTTGSLPAGLAAATTYYIVLKNSTKFKVSATRGGSAIDITSAGTGVHTATRYNGHASGDLIENPVYVVESVLRDVLGLTSADVNAASFDELGNADDGRRSGWKYARSLMEQMNSLDFIGQVAQEGAFFYLQDFTNKGRVVAIDHYGPSTELSLANIVETDGIPQVRVRQTHVKDIRNDFFLSYDWDPGRQAFEKTLFLNGDGTDMADNTRNDKGALALYTGLCGQSRTMYNVTTPWKFEAYGIRDSATAEKFLKAMADWLAIRKWEVRAKLVKSATTLGLELMDQVLFNLALLPVSMRNTTVQNLANATGAGGALADGDYYYRVAPTDLYGEGKACAELHVNIAGGGGTRKNTLTWDAVTGATGYRVYGRATGAQDRYWDVTTETFADAGQVQDAMGTPINTVPAFFLTELVDHGLRDNMSFEAVFVACPTVFF